jgi:DNA-directed RNA polymerase II subunit RPB1
MSSVVVKSPDSHDGGTIKSDGVISLRMGPGESMRLRCQTCGSGTNQCVGHYGSLHMPKPVLNIVFSNAICDVLRCVCFQCSRVLLNNCDREYKIIDSIPNPKRRFTALKKEILKRDNKKGQLCSFINRQTGEEEGCLAVQPIYRQEDKLKIVTEYRDQHGAVSKLPLLQDDAERILKVIIQNNSLTKGLVYTSNVLSHSRV